MRAAASAPFKFLFASSVDREQIADATGDGIDVMFGVDSKAGAGPEVVGECERVVDRNRSADISAFLVSVS